MKYVILLRGINVGGNRKVSMNQLRECITDLGCTEVATYINSGNLVCRSSVELTAECVASAIEATVGFAVDTLVLPGSSIQRIAAAIPDEWTNDTTQKSDVAYLFPGVDTPDALEQIGYKPAIETMKYVPGAIVMNVSRANQQRGSLKAAVGTPLYRQMTIRNVNTARKLAEMVAE